MQNLHFNNKIFWHCKTKQKPNLQKKTINGQKVINENLNCSFIFLGKAISKQSIVYILKNSIQETILTQDQTFKVIGSLFNTYILVEKNNSLLLI